MAWYRAGTVTVAIGSTTVTGAGTDFVSNVGIGDAFIGPDGRAYEIAQIVSATQLVLADAYQGASAGGQAYKIQPTQSYIRDLALGASQLVNSFGAVRDGVGAGLFPDGTVAAPGIRFAADQDTGIRRYGANGLAIVAGGVDRVIVGSGPEIMRLQSSAAAGAGQTYFTFFDGGGRKGYIGYGASANDDLFVYNDRAGALRFYGGGIEMGRFDKSGNLLVGVDTGSYHTIRKVVAPGQIVLRLDDGNYIPFQAFGCNGYGYSQAASATWFGVNTTTNRSINAGGTINASGADYAEYMTKADGCGTIAAGDVCGVTRDGKLTRTWADAIAFVIKSTDPAYVGGDIWAAHLPPRPEQPDAEPIEPSAPPASPAGDDDAALAVWHETIVAYPGLLASYKAAHATWAAAQAAYEQALAEWETQLEAARHKVDRIAFCGQVPVNMDGEFAPGDYLIAVASGAGIKAIAVAEADITFDQYRRRLGRVWADRDGRPWVDVQHG